MIRNGNFLNLLKLIKRIDHETEKNMEELVEKLGIADHDFRLIIGRTKIDYDEAKEDINRKKHGYSLLSAVHLLEKQLLFQDTRYFLTSDPFMENSEVRHMHLGFDDYGNIVLMITTMKSNETVRVISFRRASDKERETFIKMTGYNP